MSPPLILMRIAIATLTQETLPVEYTLSLIKMVHETKLTCSFLINRSANITLGRNNQFFEAKENNYDYILYIDSDIVFPGDALKKLIALDKDVASGIYYSREYPFRPVIHKFVEHNQIRNYTEWPESPFKVDSTGAGFLLIRNTVFDIFEKNKYEPFAIVPNGLGEEPSDDTCFCIRCKEKMIDIWVDPSIELGHIRKDVVTSKHWEIAKANIEGLKAEQDIQGWMTSDELRWLSEKAFYMDSIVEIGSWKGRSTCSLLENCRGVVYSVDHFLGDKGVLKEIIRHEGNIFPQFAMNVAEFDNLIVMKMSSIKASNFFQDKGVDMVFIDAGHTYEEVKDDIKHWMPKTSKLICGHDYCNDWPGVMKAVDEVFPDRTVVDSIWYKDL